jgi:hypothetical protein
MRKKRYPGHRDLACQQARSRYTRENFLSYDDDDDDKLYLTTLTLSAEAGFHNGRVKNINKLLQVK